MSSRCFWHFPLFCSSLALRDSFTRCELKSQMYTFRHLPEYLFLSMALAVWYCNKVQNTILRSKQQENFLGSSDLHFDKLGVHPFLPHQFTVASLLHNDSISSPTMTSAFQTVDNQWNGSLAFSGLMEKRTNVWGSMVTRSSHCQLTYTIKHVDGRAHGGWESSLHSPCD